MSRQLLFVAALIGCLSGSPHVSGGERDELLSLAISGHQASLARVNHIHFVMRADFPGHVGYLPFRVEYWRSGNLERRKVQGFGFKGTGQTPSRRTDFDIYSDGNLVKTVATELDKKTTTSCRITAQGDLRGSECDPFLFTLFRMTTAGARVLPITDFLSAAEVTNVKRHAADGGTAVVVEATGSSVANAPTPTGVA